MRLMARPIAVVLFWLLAQLHINVSNAALVDHLALWPQPKLQVQLDIHIIMLLCPPALTLFDIAVPGFTR